MKKVKSLAEIFLIVIVIKAAIILSFILAPLVAVIGLAVLIWFLIVFLKEDFEEYKNETKKDDDNLP